MKLTVGFVLDDDHDENPTVVAFLHRARWGSISCRWCQ